MGKSKIPIGKIKHFFLNNTVNIMPIRGKSMYPALQEGWSAQINPIDKDKIKIGDIVVFCAGEELIAHRIVGKIRKGNKTYFLQKGDNELKHGFILEDQVIGRVSNVFNAARQEVSLKLWKSAGYKEAIIFMFLRALYLVLYQVKQVVFQDKINILVRLFWKMYWAVFYGLSKKNKKAYEYL